MAKEYLRWQQSILCVNAKTKCSFPISFQFNFSPFKDEEGPVGEFEIQ
jgi:hypothetical protein